MIKSIKKILNIFLATILSITCFSSNIQANEYKVLAQITIGEVTYTKVWNHHENREEVIYSGNTDLKYGYSESDYVVLVHNSGEVEKIKIEFEEKIQYIDANSKVELFSTTPTWGATLARTYTFDSSEVAAGTVAISVLLDVMMAKLDFGLLSTVVTGLIGISTELFPKKIKVTETYQEAVGCPQLRKYLTQTVYDYYTGKTMATGYSGQVVFLGVTHNPSNPPMCRQYGY